MPDLVIRSNFNALDEDAQGLGQNREGGYPTSSALGREITENDRWVWANLRRHHVAHAWPRLELGGAVTEAKPPTVGLVAGHNVGPFRSIGTPGATAGEWYIIAKVAARGQIQAVPYCNHPTGPEPLQPPPPNLAAFNITNAGAAAAEMVIGPISTGLTDGMITAGIVFYSMQPSAGWYATNKGTVAAIDYWGDNSGNNLSVVDSGTDSDFAGIAVAAGGGATGYALRIVNAADNSIILSAWHDILWTADGRTNDANGAAVVYPALDDDRLAGQRIQISPISTLELLSVTLRELPASGVFSP